MQKGMSRLCSIRSRLCSIRWLTNIHKNVGGCKSWDVFMHIVTFHMMFECLLSTLSFFKVHTHIWIRGKLRHLLNPVWKTSLIQCRRWHLCVLCRLCAFCPLLQMLLQRRWTWKLARQTWMMKPGIAQRRGSWGCIGFFVNTLRGLGTQQTASSVKRTA